MFTPQDDAEPAAQHTSDVEGGIGASFEAVSQKQRDDLIIGEWSCALTDQSLQGEQDPNAARQAFCTGQDETYANTSAGWSFWGESKSHPALWAV